MKLNNIVKICALSLLLALPEACQKYYPMVPPPIKDTTDDLDEELGASSPIYITVYGSGTMDGTSWDNAMDNEGLRDLFTNHIQLSRRSIYVAEGKYVVSPISGEGITISKDMFNIKGGFPSDSRGTDVKDWDPAKYHTIFSGDVNGNSQVDNADCALFKVTNGNVCFEGCQFVGGYLSQTLSASLKGQIGAGFYINGAPESTSVTVINCEFKNNVTVVKNNTDGSVAGGPCALVDQGTFKARDCRFISNSTSDGGRGGALRANQNDACIFLDRCFFSGNQSNQFGQAIQISAGHLLINNSTFVDNTGDRGVINGGGAFLICNSTVVGDTDDTTDYAFRCESASGNKNSKLINNVFASEKSAGFGVNINHNSPDVTSMGGNIYQRIKYGDNNDKSATIFPLYGSDIIVESPLAGSLNGDLWVYTLPAAKTQFVTAQDVIDAVKSFKPTMGKETAFGELGVQFYNWVGEAGFKVDYSGNARNEDKFMPGSYDSKL